MNIIFHTFTITLNNNTTSDIMSYKVSLITPCYNLNNIDSAKQNLFYKSLESVRKQTIGYENIEHILINNGSTDGTEIVLEELAQKYSNIKLLSINENTGGPSIPRNMGIKEATSDYIMFLDSDDVFKENACEILYKEIKNNDVDMVNSNYYSFDGKETFKHVSRFKGRNVIKPKSADSMNFMMSYLWTAIYKREFLVKNNISFPNMYAEDVSFLTDCIITTNKNMISLNDFYSCVYTADNNSSVSHNFSKKIVRDYLNIYQKCINKLINTNQDPLFIEEFYQSNILIVLGSLIRSTETKTNKYELFDLLKDYLEKNKDIPLELSFYWNFMIYLIKHNHKQLFFSTSSFIQSVFEQNWFRKLFRNKSYVKE